MRRRALVLLPLLGLLGALGCAGSERRDESAERYHRVREAWTRQDKLLAKFELQVALCATYLAPEFRAARERHLNVLYAHNDEQRAALAEREARAGAAGEEFLVGVFVPDRRWDKLHRRRSPWNLRLLVDELDPVPAQDILRFKRPQPEVEALYPHIEIWDRVYRVIFPKERADGTPTVPAGARIIRLAMDGPLATAKLEWNLAATRAATK